MRGLFQDVPYAFRQLRKSPSFTAVVVLTLALGIGANTAIFSVIDAVLLRPLPFKDPGRVVAVKTTEPDRRDDIGVSYPAFLDWRSRNHVFEGISAFRTEDFTLTGSGEPAHLRGAIVSANLPSLLGVLPMDLALSSADKPEAKARRVTFLTNLFAGIRTIPGVSGVGGTGYLPLMGGDHPDGTYVVMSPGQAAPRNLEELEPMNPGNTFVPFYTTKPEGSGIGLVLSRQIAEAHGGSLELSNRSGERGCVVRVNLPIKALR